MLAIMSLMLGAVVMVIPKDPAPIVLQAKKLTAQINHGVQDGILSNQITALSLSSEGFAFGALSGDGFSGGALTPWADYTTVGLTRDGQSLDLPEGDAVPLFIFEPTGNASVFTLALTGESERFVITSKGDGRVSLEQVR